MQPAHIVFESRITGLHNTNTGQHSPLFHLTVYYRIINATRRYICCSWCLTHVGSMTWQALLGPLEQQEVCVAKAGLVASLPARTSLLAAANPAGGQYNRAKTLLQNLKMSAAMLSRFDVIFVLLDQPDQRRDERLSEHIMAMHSGGSPVTLALKSDNDYHSLFLCNGVDNYAHCVPVSSTLAGCPSRRRFVICLSPELQDGTVFECSLQKTAKKT